MRNTHTIPLLLISLRILGVAFSLFLLYARCYEVFVVHRYEPLDFPYVLLLAPVMLPYSRMQHPRLWTSFFVPMALLSATGLALVIYFVRRYPLYYIAYDSLPAVVLFAQVGVIWACRHLPPSRRYLADASDPTKKRERRLVVTLVGACLLVAAFDAAYIAVKPIATPTPTLLMRTDSLGTDRIDARNYSTLTKLLCQADYFLSDEIGRYQVPFFMYAAVSQDGKTMYYVFGEPNAVDSYIIYQVKAGALLPLARWYDGGA